MLSKIGNVDVPQPENLLGELADVVERVNQASYSLLSDSQEVLAQLNVLEKVIEDVSNFVPIDRDPGCRTPILTDENKMYLIQQGPFQPILGRYPQNPDIPPSNISSAIFHLRGLKTTHMSSIR